MNLEQAKQAFFAETAPITKKMRDIARRYDGAQYFSDPEYVRLGDRYRLIRLRHNLRVTSNGWQFIK